MAASRLELSKAAFLFLAAALWAAGSVDGQEVGTAELRGRVLLGEDPLPSVRVVLHRVSAGNAGPVDSLRSGADGRFRFGLPSVPDASTFADVWFFSVDHEGVEYFGTPIHGAAQLDSLHVLQVYDTTVAPAAGALLRLSARYTMLEGEPEGWYVTDMMQLVNDGGRTLVAGTGGATWVYPLPAGAVDLEIGGEQMAPNAARIVEGALRVTSAIPPGQREVLVRYRLPDPFVTLRYPGVTSEVGLLVREPAPRLAVEGLVSEQPVEMAMGVRYQRYTGAQLVDAVVSVRELVDPPELLLGWVAVSIAMTLTGAGVFAVLRPRDAVARMASAVPAADMDVRMSPFERRQLLLLEVARLDEESPDGTVHEDQRSARRRALLRRVRELGSDAP